MSLKNRENLGSSPFYTVHAEVIQSGIQNEPVFDLVLNIQPCREQCFVTW
jgi:hypothetical protein